MRNYLWFAMVIVGTMLIACCRAQHTPSPMESPLSPLSTPSSLSGSGLIAFYSDRETGHYQIYVMDSDGSNVRRLTDFAPPNSQPTWSSDGSRIAFTSGKDDINNFTLYVINVDGTGPRRLLEPGHGDNWHPAWSPRGDLIAFQSNRDRDAGDPNLEIYVVTVETGQVTRLTHSEKTDSMPAWSPDGEKIAFVSNRDGDGEIYVMKADGTDQVRLTHSPGEDTQPAWSPDGTKILFMSTRDGSGEIYVMNADGSEQTRLTFTELYGEWTPRWAMHGTRILFSASYDKNWEIYLMDLDGSNVVRLTDDPGDDRHAAWLDLD